MIIIIYNRTTMDATFFHEEEKALAHIAVCEQAGDEFNVVIEYQE